MPRVAQASRQVVGRDHARCCGWRRARHRALVVLGSFLSSVLDLIGLTMMVPLIIAATERQEFDQGHRRGGAARCWRALGLPFAPLPILTIIIVGLALKAMVGVLVTRYVGQVVAG